jgi:hypothetical protein
LGYIHIGLSSCVFRKIYTVARVRLIGEFWVFFLLVKKKSGNRGKQLLRKNLNAALRRSDPSQYKKFSEK